MKLRREFFAYFGMDLADGRFWIDELWGGGARGHISVTSRGLRGRVWTFRKNDFVHFQDLLLLFQAVFTQWHVHNRALEANGEAVSQEGAAVQSQVPLASSPTRVKSQVRSQYSCERAYSCEGWLGCIWRSGRCHFTDWERALKRAMSHEVQESRKVIFLFFHFPMCNLIENCKVSQLVILVRKKKMAKFLGKRHFNIFGKNDRLKALNLTLPSPIVISKKVELPREKCLSCWRKNQFSHKKGKTNFWETIHFILSNIFSFSAGKNNDQKPLPGTSCLTL